MGNEYIIIKNNEYEYPIGTTFKLCYLKDNSYHGYYYLNTKTFKREFDKGSYCEIELLKDKIMVSLTDTTKMLYGDGDKNGE